MGSQGWVSTLIYLGVLIAIFYFLLIMPRKKEEKKHQSLLESLKKGDKIVSIGGIHGKISHIKDNTVMLKVNENNEIELLKKAVAYKVED